MTKILAVLVGLAACAADPEDEVSDLSEIGDPEAMTSAGAATYCPAAAENTTLSFPTVMRLGSALTAGGEIRERSASFPGNAFFAHEPSAPTPAPITHGGTTYRFYAAIWVNYCTPLGLPGTNCRRDTLLTKGNYIVPAITTSFAGDPAYQIRPVFRSYADADACTLAQIASRLGLGETAVNRYISLGPHLRKRVRPDTSDALLKDLATERVVAGERVKVLDDVCLVDRVDEPSTASGIVLDYEVHDKRTPAQALALMTRIGRLVKDRTGKEIVLFTNSLQQAITRAENGIDASNVNDILGIVDTFSPIIWSGATPGAHMIGGQPWRWSFETSLAANLGVIDPRGTRSFPVHKFIPTISLWDLSAAEARRLHDLAKDSLLGGIKIWNNGVPIDTDCSNPHVTEVLRCLTSNAGACSDPTSLGTDRRYARP